MNLLVCCFCGYFKIVEQGEQGPIINLFCNVKRHRELTCWGKKETVGDQKCDNA